MLATDPQRCLETPPRTWRRLRLSIAYLFQIGNTSTDVEKTFFSACQAAPSQKHLHGRGEDRAISRAFNRCWETPPRTWRRPEVEVTAPAVTRNTSTDVEKTGRPQLHLHGHAETPPRTWRRRSKARQSRRLIGNTSTDVEKTRLPLRASHKEAKHLHGRGEDPSSICGTRARLETPPRTWRRLDL